MEKKSSGDIKTAIDEALKNLTEKESTILKHRFGLIDGETKTLAEIGEIFKLSSERIRQIEAKALRKLKHPSRNRKLAKLAEDLEKPQITHVQEIIESVDKLTPHLIQHLKDKIDNLSKLPWDVFEQLIAEFFASWGYQEVRLIGRDPSTSADIFALKKDEQSGVEYRYYVEVKRWRKKVGIGVITQVYGAYQSERNEHGWHLGMIVSRFGFANFRKIKREQWIKKGIELRDEEDIREWLSSYKPNKQGLWLPDPVRKMLI